MTCRSRVCSGSRWQSSWYRVRNRSCVDSKWWRSVPRVLQVRMYTHVVYSEQKQMKASVNSCRTSEEVRGHLLERPITIRVFPSGQTMDQIKVVYGSVVCTWKFAHSKQRVISEASVIPPESEEHVKEYIRKARPWAEATWPCADSAIIYPKKLCVATLTKKVFLALTGKF